jgi:hypothetical protein
MDLGMTRVRTDIVVALDVDAFPLSKDWLDLSLAALGAGKLLSGAHIHRNYIHPCFLVARRNTLVMNNLSFRPIGTFRSDDGRPYGMFLDVGEAISQAVIARFGQASVHEIPPSEVKGPGMGSTVFGHVVYHNFHSSYGPYRETALARFAEAVERFGTGSSHGEEQ